jgi:nicotinamidase-related amidase
MRAAVLVIDLVKDTFKHDTPLAHAAREICHKLNPFLSKARQDGHRVVFSTDSFLPGDFIFQGRMSPHSLRGTEGAEIAGELQQDPKDLWVPKRRLSAFFKTDLDQTLRLWGVEVVAVAGIATQFCVLATALDAISHDFRVVILEDLSASMTPESHEAALGLYRRNVLDPLFKIMTGEAFLEAHQGDA